MKKVIAWILIAVLVISCSATGVAVNLSDGNRQADIGVYAKAVRDVAGEYSAQLQHGRASVSTDQGVTVSVSGAPSGAVRLVVVPIPPSESEAWAWFSDCLEDLGTPVQAYDIYFLDASGNRVNASGAEVTMDAPAGVDTLAVCSLTTGGAAQTLNSRVQSGKVTFSTDGSTYYVLAEAGGSGAPTYPPIVTQPEGGTVTVTPKYPTVGSEVTIIPEPDEGYEVDEVTVTDKDGNLVEVTSSGDGTYSFIQPNGKVTITVTFKTTETEPEKDPVKDCPKDRTCPAAKFIDVPLNDWKHDGIHYCVENGLMNGIGDTTFAPDGNTARAMLVTVLYRLEGEPAVGKCPFSDVPQGEWYTDAVIWAAENKIVEGYDGKFNPTGDITREQFATILYRYAVYKGYDVSVGEDTNILSFVDAEEISSWAKDAMQWAVGAGLINGKDGALLDPSGKATRAEMAAILYRFCENVVE